MPSERRPMYCDPSALTDEPRKGYVEVSRVRGRSPEQLRFYWAVLNRVVAACSTPYPTAEHLSDALKIGCGYVEYSRTLSGEVLFRPSSISFRAMPHDEFTAYTRDAFDLISRHFLGGEPVEIVFDAHPAPALLGPDDAPGGGARNPHDCPAIHHSHQAKGR